MNDNLNLFAGQRILERMIVQVSYTSKNDSVLQQEREMQEQSSP